jgi:predicted MFS family arabinose efflux permease
MSEYRRQLTLLRREARLLLAATAVFSIGFPGINFVLLTLYLRRLGFDLPFIGVMIGSGQVACMLVSLPMGWVGRRLGPWAALLIGLPALALCMALLLSVEALPKSLWGAWLIGCWVLAFIAASLYLVNAVPYLMDVTGPRERGHAFALMQSLQSLGGFAGNLLAGGLVSLFSVWLGSPVGSVVPYRAALWAIVPVMLLTLLILLRARPARARSVDRGHASTRAVQTAVTPAPVRLLLWFGLLVTLESVGVGAQRYVSLYLDAGLGVPSAGIGVMMGAGSLLATGTALLAPSVIKRLGTMQTVGLTTLGVALCTLLLATIATWQVATFALAGGASLLAITYPSRSMFGQESVAPEWRTTVSAVSTIANTLACAGMSMAGGYLIATGGYGGLFSLAAACVGGSALLMLASVRRHPAAGKWRMQAQLPARGSTGRQVPQPLKHSEPT